MKKVKYKIFIACQLIYGIWMIIALNIKQYVIDMIKQIHSY